MQSVNCQIYLVKFQIILALCKHWRIVINVGDNHQDVYDKLKRNVHFCISNSSSHLSNNPEIKSVLTEQKHKYIDNVDQAYRSYVIAALHGHSESISIYVVSCECLRKTK